jgi:hypothetical protein
MPAFLRGTEENNENLVITAGLRTRDVKSALQNTTQEFCPS